MIIDIKPLALKHTAWIINQVKNKWNQRSDINGEANIDFNIAEDKNILLVDISISGMKALELEYGTGSNMDKSNPYFSYYINQDSAYNKLRNKHGGAITGRKEGSYTDLDGNEKYSTGNVEGLNLEELSNYPTILPMHYFEEAINDYLPIIEYDLANYFVSLEIEKMFPKKLVI